LSPEINAIFNNYCENVSGKLKIKEPCEGVLKDIIPKATQTFFRIESSSSAEAIEARFNHFTNKVRHICDIRVTLGHNC
jgi:hypothetical protein